ncbi:MAG: hypothetical protein E7568_01055 [Ruminococcaceae bacterium]|nr:hypothetical protein [Oscillospiraceae bacterium]
MHKIINIIFILLIFCAGCKKIEEFTPPDYPVIVAPDDKAEATADGYKEITAQGDQNIVYYVNKESKKIHLPDCRYAKMMSEDKVLLEKDYENLLINGYTPCGVCKP